MAGVSEISVVLVHGGFVDGSGWEDVYKILKKDGYNVSIVQNPTISLADDVAATKRIVARAKGAVGIREILRKPLQSRDIAECFGRVLR
jgi:hypothetical protein